MRPDWIDFPTVFSRIEQSYAGRDSLGTKAYGMWSRYPVLHDGTSICFGITPTGNFGHNTIFVCPYCNARLFYIFYSWIDNGSIKVDLFRQDELPDMNDEPCDECGEFVIPTQNILETKGNPGQILLDKDEEAIQEYFFIPWIKARRPDVLTDFYLARR